MKADLAQDLDTLIRDREAHNASASELALLRRLAAMFPKPPKPTCTLTRRQADLLPLLLDGQSMKVCGKALGISLDTAKDHARRVYAAYGVHSRAELMSLSKLPVHEVHP